MTPSDPPKYILLPRNSIIAKDEKSTSILTQLPTIRSTAPSAVAPLSGFTNREVRVIDSIAENGPKLIQASQETIGAINDSNSPVRAVLVETFPHPILNISNSQTTQAPSASAISTKITITDSTSGSGVPGMEVAAYTNFQLGQGDKGITDRNGDVNLWLSGNNIEKLLVTPAPGYWGAFRQHIPITSLLTFKVDPISLGYKDCIRTTYPSTKFKSSTGVKVGVIDTGVGPHSHLNIVKGINTVTGESKTDYLDWQGHGTHVAGLIGANASPPNGLRGMAPNAEIVAIRVFGKNRSGATNYSVLKAMIKAADNECDIINLSLGGGPANEIVKEAIKDAQDNGMLIVIAAGNDGRKPVTFPAANPGALAISAMGITGTFPPGSLEEDYILKPPSSLSSPNHFMAKFTNTGNQISMAGLGVGTLSTLPNQNYGPLSGTSMAAPMVAGAAASLLSNDLTIFNMPRDDQRSFQLERLITSSCTRFGFGSNFEGYGLPDPALI